MLTHSTLIGASRRLVPLGPWLTAAQASGVPFIPAEFSNDFAFEAVDKALDHNIIDPELEGALRWAEELVDSRREQGQNYMSRWECCASSAAKSAASRGKPYQDPDPLPWRDEYPYCLGPGCLDDPRLYDCNVTPRLRIAVRPCVEPMRVDGYPMEFRVFFGPSEDGVSGMAAELIGVSNYYPQRPLSTEYAFLAVRVNGLAQSIWDQVSTDADISLTGATMDFLVDTDEHVWFLEGGPPHWDGPISAHPCCFAPNKISGIALEPQPGALIEDGLLTGEPDISDDTLKEIFDAITEPQSGGSFEGGNIKP